MIVLLYTQSLIVFIVVCLLKSSFSPRFLNHVIHGFRKLTFKSSDIYEDRVILFVNRLSRRTGSPCLFSSVVLSCLLKGPLQFSFGIKDEIQFEAHCFLKLTSKTVDLSPNSKLIHLHSMEFT